MHSHRTQLDAIDSGTLWQQATSLHHTTNTVDRYRCCDINNATAHGMETTIADCSASGNRRVISTWWTVRSAPPNVSNEEVLTS